MKHIAVLGNGQLGFMLKQAGERIGLAVELLDIEQGSVPDSATVITSEREHWPVNTFTTALQQHPNWLNQRAYDALVDRRSQKAFLDQLALPVADWYQPTDTDDQATLHRKLGSDVFLKSAKGGYDGRGQVRLQEGKAVELPSWLGESIAERGLNFETEVSIVAARDQDGKVAYFRLTENYHQDGILLVSISREHAFEGLQPKAEQMVTRVMEALNYVGVLTIEFFVVNGELIINEIAPRVHNSGHWTQIGAALSQFDLHIRAVSGLPIVAPVQEGSSVMINLIGIPFDTHWLMHQDAHVNWYGKELRPGRKMGHINLHHANSERLMQSIQQIQLPENYGRAIHWVLGKLCN